MTDHDDRTDGDDPDPAHSPATDDPDVDEDAIDEDDEDFDLPSG